MAPINDRGSDSLAGIQETAGTFLGRGRLASSEEGVLLFHPSKCGGRHIVSGAIGYLAMLGGKAEALLPLLVREVQAEHDDMGSRDGVDREAFAGFADSHGSNRVQGDASISDLWSQTNSPLQTLSETALLLPRCFCRGFPQFLPLPLYCVLHILTPIPQ